MSIYITRHIVSPELCPQEHGERPGLLRRWWLFLVRKWRRRQAIMALADMDDRLLRDIGVYRAGIERAVDGFEGRRSRSTPRHPVNTDSRSHIEEYRKAA